MNATSFITKDYRKNDDFAVQKNKPNSKPISEKPKMNVNFYLTEDYENETAFRLEQNKPNSNPIQTQSPSAIRDTQYEIRDTNPIKLEANLSLRERRSLRVSFLESSNRGPISPLPKSPKLTTLTPFYCRIIFTAVGLKKPKIHLSRMLYLLEKTFLFSKSLSE